LTIVLRKCYDRGIPPHFFYIGGGYVCAQFFKILEFFSREYTKRHLNNKVIHTQPLDKEVKGEYNSNNQKIPSLMSQSLYSIGIYFIWLFNTRACFVRVFISGILYHFLISFLISVLIFPYRIRGLKIFFKKMDFLFLCISWYSL